MAIKKLVFSGPRMCCAVPSPEGSERKEKACSRSWFVCCCPLSVPRENFTTHFGILKNGWMHISPPKGYEARLQRRIFIREYKLVPCIRKNAPNPLLLQQRYECKWGVSIEAGSPPVSCKLSCLSTSSFLAVLCPFFSYTPLLPFSCPPPYPLCIALLVGSY